MRTIIYILLYPVYLVYLLIISVRNYCYDKKLFSVTRLNCKIISIGNVSMGGTGKTPLVIELVNALQQNYKIAILSRGYGRTTKGTHLVTDGNSKVEDWKIVGDEPTLISQKISGAPIVVDEDRVRGGNYLVNNFNPDIILLDDAFQHRKLYRDIDIVLINANTKPSLNFLREPWIALKRADLVLITKGEDVHKTKYWEKKVANFNVPVSISNLVVGQSVIDSAGNKFDLDIKQNKTAILLSGIADPTSFANTANEVGFKITDHIIFKDHHQYTKSDIIEIQKKYYDSNPDIILTTEKDIVRLPKSDLPIYALPINLVISSDTLKQIKNNLKRK